jgi:hypothetical protein
VGKKRTWNLDIETPANGRLRKSTVTVLGKDGEVKARDMANLDDGDERRKLARRLLRRLKGDVTDDGVATMEESITDRYGEILTERGRVKREAATGAGDQTTIEILDDHPNTINRPLCLVNGRAYAGTWINVQTVTRQSVNRDTGEVRTFDPPQVVNVSNLVIVRDDGALFSTGIPGAAPPDKLGLEVKLPAAVMPSRGWSGAGLKRYAAGERMDPADVFRRVTQVVDCFMDFGRSLKSQDEMCELVACYILATYFLDAFDVIGYLWPNGDRGAGKTNLLHVVAELAYLGQVILAGGSYATLRDLADYGATLAFDDAEGVMDVKRADPDKRALLLAGNRRGATVTVKEPSADRGWTVRHIHTFAPRLFSAIRLPDDVLGSRSIILPLVRSGDGQRSKRSPLDPAAWPCERRRLIDDLWAIGLVHLAELRTFDEQAASKAQLTGRDLEPWRAILAVALWLQERHGQAGLFERLEKLSVDYQTERSDLEAHDPVRLLIVALREMVAAAGDAVFEFATSDLKSTMNRLALENEVAEEGKEFINSRKVGRLLERLRFQKAPRNARQKRWETRKTEVDALARRYGMAPADQCQDAVSAVSAVNKEGFEDNTPPPPDDDQKPLYANGTNGTNGKTAQPQDFPDEIRPGKGDASED